MTDILKLMVQELMKEGLSAEELRSLTLEVSKNSDLVNFILNESSGSLDAKDSIA